MPRALFAAGCFWGVQFYFDQIPGVIQTTAGYTGGHVENPTYEEVCSHTTGHAEAVEVVYDQDMVTYETLVRHFFRMHDPTQLNRQGPDIGDSYRSAIFYTTPEQHEIADAVLAQLQPSFGGRIVTEVSVEVPFYPAEGYHQNTLSVRAGECATCRTSHSEIHRSRNLLYFCHGYNYYIQEAFRKYQNL